MFHSYEIPQMALSVNVGKRKELLAKEQEIMYNFINLGWSVFENPQTRSKCEKAQ